jgi:L-iditol 2-dehydrogenase
VEPLAVALHALELPGGVRGATVGVVGCGPIGLLLVAVARSAGASAIIATDPLRHRLDVANEMGATTTVEATPARGEREVILGATGGRGVDIAFEASGEGAAVETAVHVARPGGEVVLVGIPPDDQTSFRASIARRKGLTLRLSRRSSPRSFRRAVATAEAGTIDLARLVTHRVPLREATRAFDTLVRREGIKIVVEPGGGA